MPGCCSSVVGVTQKNAEWIFNETWRKVEARGKKNEDKWVKIQIYRRSKHYKCIKSQILCACFCFVVFQFHAFFRELCKRHNLDFGLSDVGGGMPPTKIFIFFYGTFIREATLCVLVVLVNLYADLGENTFAWTRAGLQLKAKT